MRIYLSRPHMSGREERRVAEAFACNFVAPVGPQLDAFEEIGAGLPRVRCAVHRSLFWLCGPPPRPAYRRSRPWRRGLDLFHDLRGRHLPRELPRSDTALFDLSPTSWTIDTALLAEELAKAARENRLPKAIVPTDLYGQSVDLDALEILAAQYEVHLIIDSAESLGALYTNGRKAGTGGDAAILSFNGNKIITTSGGGMLITRHKNWADEARYLATQARDPAPHYEHSTYGYNYRLSNICAAIGLGQMEVLDARVARRREIFARYEAALARHGVAFMPEPEGLQSTRWLTTFAIDPAQTGVTREDIRMMLLDHRIKSRPLWKPMHMQPLYAGAPYHGRGADEELFANGLCLPSGSDMTDGQQDEVIELVTALLDARR